MRITPPVQMFAALLVALLAAGPSFAQPGLVIGAGALQPVPALIPYPPYPYGGYIPTGPCLPGQCVDGIQLRRAIRRELQVQELRRELDLRAAQGVTSGGGSPYLVPRYMPPPTPESHLQPSHKGTGEIRPEYRNAGQAR